MTRTRSTISGTVLVALPVTLLLGLALTACSIDVRNDGPDRRENVDIRTPVGDVSVHSGGDEVLDTGIPLFPGVTRLLDDGEPENATVDIGVFGVGVKVAAAKYESAATPQSILDFYRQALPDVGPVTECRGEVDFDGGRAICSPRPSQDYVQLVAGPGHNQHVVVVKPRGTGSELSLVHVQTSGVD